MRLFWHQLRSEQLVFWRSREAAVFVFLFPLLLFALLTAVYNGHLYGRPASWALLAGMLGYGAANTAFAGLGLAITGFVRSLEGSSAALNLVVLPMAFLSGSFGTTRHYPRALRAIGDVLPLKYLLDAINAIYLHGRQLWDKPTAVAVLAGWGVFGIAVALRKFRWEPREG